MTKQEMIDKLNLFIIDNYAKQIGELNKAVIFTPTENGKISAPGFEITAGGGNLIKGEVSIELQPPAVLRVTLVAKDVMRPLYRILLPFEEMDVACNNDAYLAQIMNFVLSKAISNYIHTFGPIERVRYGLSYLNIPEVSDYHDDFLITFTGEYVE